MYLLKSHVRAHTRKNASGTISIVRDHNDKRTRKFTGNLQADFNIGDEVYFKPEGTRKTRRGTCVGKTSAGYVIQGLRDQSGKSEKFTLKRHEIETASEYQARKAAEQEKSGTREVTSTHGRTISTQESLRRKEAGMSRLGMTEDEVMTALKPRITRDMAKLARGTNLVEDKSSAMNDAEYGDATTEYTIAMLNSLRHEAETATDDEIEQFKQHLKGEISSSRIYWTVSKAGKNAAIDFMNERIEQKKDLVDIQSGEEDPEMRRHLANMTTPANQERLVDEMWNGGGIERGIERFLSKLPDTHAEIIRLKFGLGDYEPHSNEQVAEVLNKQGLKHEDKHTWTRNNVGTTFNEAVAKLRETGGIDELREFVKSLKEHVTLMKSERPGCPWCGSVEYESRARCMTAPTVCVCGKEYFACPKHKGYVKGHLPQEYSGVRNSCICDKAEIKENKTICIDFDGVIAEYDTWKGEDVFGEPIAGAAEAIKSLKESGWKIIIFTTRKDTPALRDYLMTHGIPFDEINTNAEQPEDASPGKPIADVYLDDRAVRFTSWDNAMKDIEVAKSLSLIAFDRLEKSFHPAGTFKLNEVFYSVRHENESAILEKAWNEEGPMFTTFDDLFKATEEGKWVTVNGRHVFIPSKQPRQWSSEIHAAAKERDDALRDGKHEDFHAAQAKIIQIYDEMIDSLNESIHKPIPHSGVPAGEALKEAQEKARERYQHA